MKKVYVILTKFNVKMNVMKTNYLDTIDISTNEEYLKERFRLFETYTVPSIKNQISKDFIWFVMFSSNTPKSFKNRVKKIQDDLPEFKPIYVNDNEELSNILNKELLSLNADYYITTRIDNDDALSIQYVKNIDININKLDINKNDNYIIIFNNGCQYDEKNNILSSYYFPTNHFSTMISKREDYIKTITDFDHMTVDKLENVVKIDNIEPMWLEVVHKTNVTNRTHIKFKSLIFDKEIFNTFGIETQKLNSKSKTIINVLFQKPRNFFRLIKQYSIKKIFIKIKQKVKKI